MDTVVFILLYVLPMATGKRILLLNYPMPSHTNELKAIGELLVEHGHEVYGVLPPTYPGLEKLQAATPVTYLTYKVTSPDLYMLWEEVQEPNDDWLEVSVQMTFIEDLTINVDPHVPILAFCDNPLSDNALYQQLQSLNFDLAIVDAFMQIRCLYVLVYRLGIPYVSHATQYEPWLQRNPALPSFVPFPVGTGDYGYTEVMTFWQRLYNTYILAQWSSSPGVAYLSDDLVGKYAPEKPRTSLNALAQQSLLWFLDTDVVLDYARPIMPNMVEVGGLTTQPGNPLSNKELADFVEGSQHGFIIVSFGSFGYNLPAKMSTIMMEAFRQIPYRVIWAYPHDHPDNVSSNIMLLPWIPQNDLLAHNKTQLFISHCGTNSQFEALYHGVPMIAFPIFGDQPYNARRGKYKGISLTLSLLTFTSQHLVDAIGTVVNGNYSERTRNLSAIFRDRPMTPKERSVYWIEHVFKYGARHLHSYAVDMPWYQYIMLDILILMLALVHAMLVASVCLVKYIGRIPCAQKSKVKIN